MQQSNSRTSAIVAVVLIIASGVAYRSVSAWYSRSGDSVMIPPGTLAKLPLEIGEWTGHDRTVEEVIIEQTGTDDHLSRVYDRTFGRDSVSLWVAYGVRMRDLLPHRPEICYVGAGWSRDSSELLTVPLADGTRLPCQIMRFRRGALATERLTVLNYYIVDGEFGADVSQVRSKAVRGSDGGYAAQVQIACGAATLYDRADDLVRDFAIASASLVQQLLEDAVRDAVAAQKGV